MWEVNPGVKVNLWLVNPRVNLSMEQSALSVLQPKPVKKPMWESFLSLFLEQL